LISLGTRHRAIDGMACAVAIAMQTRHRSKYPQRLHFCARPQLSASFRLVGRRNGGSAARAYTANISAGVPPLIIGPPIESEWLAGPLLFGFDVKSIPADIRRRFARCKRSYEPRRQVFSHAPPQLSPRRADHIARHVRKPNSAFGVIFAGWPHLLQLPPQPPTAADYPRLKNFLLPSSKTNAAGYGLFLSYARTNIAATLPHFFFLFYITNWGCRGLF